MTNLTSDTTFRWFSFAGAALSIAFAGCATDDDEPPPPSESGRGERVYAYTVNIFEEEGSTTYLGTLPSIEAGTTFDIDSSIPIPGNWGTMGVPGEPTVWLADDESPYIERWDLRDDGKFKRGERIDFSGVGLMGAYQAVNGFFSPKRGAFINNDTGKLIIWDPEKMEIVDELDLEIPDFEGIPAFVRDVVGRPDGTLIASYYYLNDDGYLRGHAGIVTVNEDLSKVIGRDEWEGCMYTTLAGQLSDGTTYFSAAGQWVLPVKAFPDDAPYKTPPCTLRILPGETSYDDDFGSLDLGTLVDDKDVAGTLRIIADDLGFFVAWHDDLVDEKLTPENWDDLGYTAPGWKWYYWDLESDKAMEVPDAEPFGGFPGVTDVEGRLLYQDQTLADTNDGFGSAPFYELTTAGVQPAFEGKGYVYSLMRVR